MTEWLVQKFVRDYNNIQNEKVRANYGALSSVVGIGLNLSLFVTKLVLGFVTGSIAITSDAINNLSDVANCIVTLFGYKMAAKPADRDHPFGHGRIEYISSLFIAVVIVLLGIELFKTAIGKILNPTSMQINEVILVILFLTILVKVWMFLFNRTLGRKTNNSVLLAVASDSLNDVLATAATLLSALIFFVFKISLDGYMGLIVSCAILYTGVHIIISMVNELIGQSANEEIIAKIEAIMTENEKVLGFHDVIIHNYGPGNLIGTAHVEVDANSDFMEAHELIDQIEKKIEKEMRMIMTIHMDPIICNDEVVDKYKKELEGVLLRIDELLTFHDFRVVIGPTHTNLIFDVVLPYEKAYETDELKKRIDAEIQKKNTSISTVITFDRGYL